MKPRPMPQSHLKWITGCAESGSAKGGRVLSVKTARAILAALEYERQRAEKWERTAYAAAERVHMLEHAALLADGVTDNHADHIRTAEQVAAAINADPSSPLYATVDGLTVVVRQRPPPTGITVTFAHQKRETAAVVQKPRKR